MSTSRPSPTVSPIRLGYQSALFDFPGVEPDGMFERAVTLAQAAEAAGFDTFFTGDHVHQGFAELGPEDLPLLESYTTLAGIAARTSTIRLGALVTAVTFRTPAMLAKVVTTLDVISRGRALLAIGSAWYEREHLAYGIDFPPLAQRAQRLEETIHVAREMFNDKRPVFSGQHVVVDGPINSPLPIQPGGPPILIGGSGERRTFPLMVRLADLANITTTIAEVPHKLTVLRQMCERHDRDPETLPVSSQLAIVVADSQKEALRIRSGFLAERGLVWDDLDDATKAYVDGVLPAGDTQQFAELLGPLLEAGLSGVTVALPAQYHDPSAIELAAITLAKALD